ncbi:replication protein RepA [Pseudomonas benzenivorans]|uniref:Replication protein RepA n=1 Tax=Pseudomonas benzenivorans TaxID=556533 RepID=A0ABZ0PQS1_9PSED|nr:replication protein RepA [Pseudomonas benzenivorans]WPC03507.1 replication protein RepA [Pseudomonas benzenivorans]
MFAINTEIESYTTIEADDVLAKAKELRADYPASKRIIGIKAGVTEAIEAAYKTASGIADTDGTVITDSIYKMSKIDVAIMIASNDHTDRAMHKAAYELARDAFLTGDIVGKSEMLALASGRSPAECQYLIERKLERMNAELYRRTQRVSSIYEDAYTVVPESAQEIAQHICSTAGKFLLNLPTGYGKTSEIIEPLVREALSCGEKVLIISHRRSINATLCTGIAGMVSYDECTSPDIIRKARALKIVVNSLSAAKFKDFIESADTVIIDEASQVISHVLGGEVKAREAVWNALNFVVKNAPTVVMADADINARCVEMIGWDHTLYSIKRDHSDITVKTGDLDHVRGLVIEATSGGENVLVSCDGAKAAKALAAAIKKRTGVEALVITSESAKWEAQAAFIADPNSTSHQVVIYSPVITSALSITSAHFTRHFGLFSGQVVPSDCIQMLRRDRTAREFIVGMKAPEYSKQEQLEALETRSDAPTTRAAIEAANIDENLKATLIEALDFDIKPSAFEMTRREHMSDEAWLRDHIQNSLPATMLAQGFKVEVLVHNDEMARLGFVADSQGRKTVNASTASKVLASKKAGTDQVARVADAGSESEQEYFEVIRARAEEVIGRTIDDSDAAVWKKGEGTITRFRKLMKPACDTPEGKVYAMIKDAVERMLKDVKIKLDADGNVPAETLERLWKSEQSTQLFDRLNEIRLEVIRQGLSIGKASTPVAKQAAITKIMSQMGLKTKKVNGGKSGYYYIIKKESFEQMMKYVV